MVALKNSETVKLSEVQQDSESNEKGLRYEVM